MTDNREILQRKVVRAFFRSAKSVDEDVRWSRYRLDYQKLSQQLNAISDKKIPSSMVREFSDRFGLTVLRVDPLKLNIYGFEKAFDRQAIAEGLGSMGVQFFPTRQSASRSAFESAREVAYFSAGSFDEQCFECPISRVLNELDGNVQTVEKGTILRDIREDFACDEVLFDILKKDIYFKAKVSDRESLEAFQKALRTEPFSQPLVEKCTEFFNRRATIGMRDTMRWMLGSRHPWFDWGSAEKLIYSAFEHNVSTDFNTAQIVYYAYDPEIDEVEIEAAQMHNQRVIIDFERALRDELEKEADAVVGKLDDKLLKLAAWALDIHHDYPDFDLESTGSLGPSKHIEFLGHSIQNKVSQEFLGGETKMRLNLNMRAHFAARGLTQSCLAELTDSERETFFVVLQDVLAEYDRLATQPESLYKRLPCKLFLIQDLGNPKPLENERLLDSFDLSEMTELEHASYMRSFSEISEALAVFFVLTLRLMIETEHVPDLKPRDFVKDFMLLGLWGTRTPNIRVNLYVDKSLDERDLAEKLSRLEVRFVGTEQVETHPLEHIREEAKALRLAVTHFAPLIEPSILRNIGTFTMAMEEFRDTSHAFKIDPVSLTHYALDMVRETARCGIKGSITDALTVFEYLLDNSYDTVQRGLDKAAQKMNSKRK